MKKLSTGQDSTLGTWLYLVDTFFSSDGPASKFLKAKIEESPNGEREEVIADEAQFLSVLGKIENEDQKRDINYKNKVTYDH